MRSLERHSANIFNLFLRPYLRKFETQSPAVVLRKSLALLDPGTINDIKKFVADRQHPSGGFTDRAGKADLYYSLFGFYLAQALEMNDILQGTGEFVRNETGKSMPTGVNLKCAAILANELTDDKKLIRKLLKNIHREFKEHNAKQAEYGAFLDLLVAYQTGDYIQALRIRKHLSKLNDPRALPSTVLAALIVLHSSFSKPVAELQDRLTVQFYSGGGFRALKNTVTTDLLSTAASLYALRFSEYDLTIIKPECLDSIDSLFKEGGFCGNKLDEETDLEYTFYGLLALGSLAD